MATQLKGYPFEAVVAGARPGAVLADQVPLASPTATRRYGSTEQMRAAVRPPSALRRA